jgi:hypothetical protein
MVYEADGSFVYLLGDEEVAEAFQKKTYMVQLTPLDLRITGRENYLTTVDGGFRGIHQFGQQLSHA